MIKIALYFCFSLTLCAQSITLALSANVAYAMDALEKEFYKEHPHIKIHVVLASSAKLSTQIRSGAPYDIFMSADMKYPDTLYLEGKAITKTQVYAKGSLALLSIKKRDFSQGLDILASSEIRRIAIANPNLAPYGVASLEVLEKSALIKKVQKKLVYGESSSQTLAYTLHASDIGFVAMSALYAPQMQKYKEGVHWMQVRAELYTPIQQGIVLLEYGKNKEAAKAFYDFILSEKAQKILQDFGYTSL